MLDWIQNQWQLGLDWIWLEYGVIIHIPLVITGCAIYLAAWLIWRKR